MKRNLVRIAVAAAAVAALNVPTAAFANECRPPDYTIRIIPGNGTGGLPEVYFEADPGEHCWN